MRGGGWFRGGLAAAALELAACTPLPDYLLVDPRAQPVRLELRKNFGRLGPRYAPVAISECAFYEIPKTASGDESASTQELWRVISLAPDRPVFELRYGSLPPGFVQWTPAGSPPPPLEPGHRYSAECTGDTRGVAAFEIPETATRSEPPLKKATAAGGREQRKRSPTHPPRRPQDDPRKRGSSP